MNKLEEIIKSWINALSPTEEQIKLAEERRKTCESCPFMISSRFTPFICKMCGCPIHKKIFSPINSCPLKKWLN